MGTCASSPSEVRRDSAKADDGCSVSTLCRTIRVGLASARGTTWIEPSSARTATRSPVATSSPSLSQRIRAAASSLSLRTSKAPSLKIGQFW